MPTIIDSFVVALGLDSSKYDKAEAKFRGGFGKTRDEANKTAKDIEAAGKKSMEAFANLRREVLSLVAVFTAGVGLKQFVEQTIETDAAVGRLAKNLDMTTEGLSAWEGVLRRSGGSAQDADAGLQALVKSFQDIQLTGQSPLIPYLNLLKISLADLKNPSETLLKMADAFSKMDPAQAAAIGQGMGLSPTMISLLERGRTAVAGMLAEQQKIGVISEADAQAAQKLQNTLSSLQQAMTSIGRTMLTVFAPALDVTAKVLTAISEWCQQNQPIVVGAFLALAAAAIALGVAMLAPAAPFILSALLIAAVGAAIGGLVEAISRGLSWFGRFLQAHQETRDAMREVGDAAHGLWAALSDAFSPLKPVFDAIAGAIRSIGAGISEAFGAGSLALARTFVNFLSNQFHALADIIRAITALLHGDLKGALAAAKDFAADSLANPLQASRPSRAAAPAAGQPGQVRPAGSAAAAAAAMIASFEGFLDHAKYDRNAFRAGYGSDTVTDARTGQVRRVTSDTRVSREDAAADLQRRVQSEFMPKVAAAVGVAWSKFSDTTKAALTSIAYNYGSLPRSVLAAARSGNLAAIASTIRARQVDNGGVNARRRIAEANAVLSSAANSNLASANGNSVLTPAASGLAVGARAQYTGQARSVVHRTDVQIDRIEVNTRATDAQGIARDLGPAIRQRTYVTQANSGLD